MVSTGNVGFIVTRLLLLLGRFSYGRRGILDLTHTRLFTFKTLRRLFEQGGFDVVESRGVPAPFPLAVGGGELGRCAGRPEQGFRCPVSGVVLLPDIHDCAAAAFAGAAAGAQPGASRIEGSRLSASLGAEWAPSDGEVPLARPDPVSG